MPTYRCVFLHFRGGWRLRSANPWGGNRDGQTFWLGGGASHLTAPELRKVANNLPIGRTSGVEDEGMYSRISSGEDQRGDTNLKGAVFSVRVASPSNALAERIADRGSITIPRGLGSRIIPDRSEVP